MLYNVNFCKWAMVTCNNYIAVPTSQSEVTVMHSHDSQPRQDDEISNGMCVHKCC